LAEEAEGLARCLVELSRHERLRVDMGLAARARVRERHSAKALADRLEGIYDGVVGELLCAS
jgi:glycosyltransferase involved in cell wall biosynthesis